MRAHCLQYIRQDTQIIICICTCIIMLLQKTKLAKAQIIKSTTLLQLSLHVKLENYPLSILDEADVDL